MQEVGLSVLRYLDRHEQPPEQFTNFLRWRVKGVISTYRRDNRDAEALPVDENLLTASGEKQPASEVSRRELKRILHECRESLREPYRLVLAMRYDEHLTVEEIATRLGARRNTVSVCLFRACRELSDCLRKRGFEPADLE